MRSSRPLLAAALLLALVCSSCGGAGQTPPTSIPTPPSPSAVAPPAVPSTGVSPSSWLREQPPTSLLSNRLAIRLPAAARIEARGHSIMAADEPMEEETRAVLDAGGERLVIMASELFARGGADPDKAIRTEADQDFDAPKPTVEPLRLADPSLKAWAVFPATVDRAREAILVLVVYVLHPDGFMQSLDFYVSPAAAGASGEGCSALAGAVPASELTATHGQLPHCTAFAYAIASTLGAGPRRLALNAGDRKLTGEYAGESFIARVPAGTSTTVQAGPDFTVHHLRLPVDLGGAAPSLGIYAGGHPSYQYRQHGSPVTPTIKAGKVFGKAVQWQVWPVSPTRIMAEVIVPHPTSQNTQVHLFASAPDEKGLDPVLDIAASLRVP